MKKLICCLAALCLLLSGCSSPTPEKAADGSVWDESWVTIGDVLGVEDPGHGLVLRDNNTALSVKDTYLASWTAGESAPYVNEDGDEVALFPARLDVLVYGCKSAEDAEAELGEWSARLGETYNIKETRELVCNGQSCGLFIYDCISDTNPYSRGAAALGLYGKYAISAELNCLDSFDADEIEIITDFLNACHYAA